MTQHYLAVTAPSKLLSKVDLVEAAGTSGDVVLVLPATPPEEVGRVHRLVTAARKALAGRSIPFRVADMEDAVRLMTTQDLSRTVVIDMDLLRNGDLSLIEQTCLANMQVVAYRLHGRRPGSSAAIFARGDSNAALAGTLIRHLSDAGTVTATSFVHVTRSGEYSTVDDSVLEAYSKVKSEVPGARLSVEQTDSGVGPAIERSSGAYDVLVLGLPRHPKKGSVTEHLLERVAAGAVRSTVLFVYARGPEVDQLASESKPIEPWILRNTFALGEFADVRRLLKAKQEQHATISLVLPALNEQKTVGQVIDAFKAPLMDENHLLDEIILMDSDSTDNTRAIAAARGIPVYIHQQVRPDLGSYAGKGETMWKSLFVATGDIVIFVDTDLTNPDPSFVTALVGPLLTDSRLSFVKGFYRRPVRVVSDYVEMGGGRVTELMARPLLNLWYPELGGLFQPLAGTIAARAAILRDLSFLTGYGVEIGHIIEFNMRWGMEGLAQSELGEILHRNQPLEALSKMSFQVLEAFFRLSNGLVTPGMIERMGSVLRQPFLSETGFRLYQSHLRQELRPPVSSLLRASPPDRGRES